MHNPGPSRRFSMSQGWAKKPMLELTAHPWFFFLTYAGGGQPDSRGQTRVGNCPPYPPSKQRPRPNHVAIIYN